MENKTVQAALRWIIIIAMPFFLGLGMILAVIAWDYPAFEYGRIAPDRYGFTPEERLDYAHATLDYLQRTEPSEEVIFLLEELQLPNSTDPLYNEAEIGHMLDVRTLWWVTAVLVIAGLGFLLLQPALRPIGYRAIYQGGLATVIILAAIALFIGVGWSIFFVQFHELLFPPGTWTFRYTDSLIRLFPEQFWFDIGVIMSVGALLLGVVVTGIGYWLVKREVLGKRSTNA